MNATSPALYAALMAEHDAAAPYAHRKVGGQWANPTLHDAYEAVEAMKHPRPTLAAVLAYAPHIEEDL